MDLIEKTVKNGCHHILFGTYQKEDFLLRYWELICSPNGTIKEMKFSSGFFGEIGWKKGIGLTDCHRWENEKEAGQASFLTYHYNNILLDGEAPLDFGRDNILGDIEKHMSQPLFKKIVQQAKTALFIEDKISLEDPAD